MKSIIELIEPKVIGQIYPRERLNLGDVYHCKYDEIFRQVIFIGKTKMAVHRPYDDSIRYALLSNSDPNTLYYDGYLEVSQELQDRGSYFLVRRFGST